MLRAANAEAKLAATLGMDLVKSLPLITEIFALDGCYKDMRRRGLYVFSGETEIELLGFEYFFDYLLLVVCLLVLVILPLRELQKYLC